MRFYDRALSADEITALYDLEKPKSSLDEGLVAYYPFNGNAKDESGKGHDGTVEGASASKDRHGTDGKAYTFDGKDDVIKIDLSNLKLTDKVTISCWAKQDPDQVDVAGRTRAISIGKGNTGVDFKLSPDAFICAAFNQKGQTISVVNMSDEVSTSANVSNRKVPESLRNNANRWMLYTMTYSGETGVVAYLNGKQIASAPVVKGLDKLLGGVFSQSSIGHEGSASSSKGRYKGSIDDIRIYDRALSADEITALYDLEKPDYSKILKEGLVAYYPFNGNATDESGNGNHGKITGAVPSEGRLGNPNGSLYFDADLDYIEIPHSESLSFEQEDFTISEWLRYPDQTKTKYVTGSQGHKVGCLFIKSDPKSPHKGFPGVSIFANSFHDTVSLRLTGAKTAKGESETVIYDDKNLHDDTWRHFVFQKRGKTLSIYIDSIRVASHEVSILSTYKNDTMIVIGANNGNRDGQNYRGRMDELRIYDRALSDDEVSALYNLEKPKTDLKKGLVAYYPFNGNANDESGNGNDGDVKGATLTVDRNNQKEAAYEFLAGDSYMRIKNARQIKGISLWLNAYAMQSGKIESNGRYLTDWRTDSGGSGYVQTDTDRFRGEFAGFHLNGKLIEPKEAAIPRDKWIHIYMEFTDEFIMEHSKLSPSFLTLMNKFSQGEGLNGKLDDIRIYNRALSADEITALYNLEKPSSETAAGTQNPGTLLWEFETGDRVHSSPAIGSDGTVYVGSKDKKLYALSGKSGVKLWEFETGDRVHPSPAIGSDGTVYVGSKDKKLYALSGKSGVKLWEFETGYFVQASPSIGSDGTVYVGSDDKKLYAIDPKSGVKLWEFETGDPVYSSPAIGPDGTVYVGSGDNKLYALNGKSGVRLWEFETGDSVWSSPAIGSDGTVYVGSDDNKLYALSGKSGVKLWEFEAGDAVNSSAIGSDGTVYVGSDDNKLYALSGKSGVKLWEFETGDSVSSSPAIGSDGTVYVGSWDHNLYAINGKSGVKLWEFETGDAIRGSSAAIGSDGTVYVGSHDGKLYAIATSSKGLADSPWPMRGQNARHTGRASAIPNSPEASAAIEAAIRKEAGKPTGELTQADLEKVTGLSLDDNQISDVSPLAGLKQLKGLLIYENRLTDISALADLKLLEQLNLRNNQISDVRSLAGLKLLESLNLQSNPDLTRAQIAELQKALPKCDIRSNPTK